VPLASAGMDSDSLFRRRARTVGQVSACPSGLGSRRVAALVDVEESGRRAVHRGSTAVSPTKINVNDRSAGLAACRGKGSVVVGVERGWRAASMAKCAGAVRPKGTAGQRHDGPLG
jgi:hypothetical protein